MNAHIQATLKLNEASVFEVAHNKRYEAERYIEESVVQRPSHFDVLLATAKAIRNSPGRLFVFLVRSSCSLSLSLYLEYQGKLNDKRCIKHIYKVYTIMTTDLLQILNTDFYSVLYAFLEKPLT